MHNLIAHCSQIVDFVTVFLFLLPESEVLLEQFDDALGVTEVVLFKLVNLVESLLEGLVSELACSLMILHDFVVEDGEVQGEAELDGVARRQSDLVGFIVSLECLLLHRFKLVGFSIFSNVAIVVTDHLNEESFGLSTARFAQHFLLDHVNNFLAVSSQLFFDLRFVARKSIRKLGILGVLLDGGNRAASSALGTDEVLESNGQEVALIRCDISTFSV